MDFLDRHFFVPLIFSQMGLMPLGLTRKEVSQSDLVSFAKPAGRHRFIVAWKSSEKVVRAQGCLRYLGLSVIHGLIIKIMWTHFYSAANWQNGPELD